MTTSLPAIQQPTEKMPTVHRHRRTLDPGEQADERVDRYTRLIPETDLPLIMTELAGRSIVPVAEEAVEMSKLLLGSYTGQKVLDPDIYVRAITSVFASFPRDLGMRAIDELTKHLRWLPERADVFTVLSRMQSQRERMRRIAEKHQQEHERRRTAAADALKYRRYHQLSPDEQRRFDERMRAYRQRLAASDDAAASQAAAE